MTDRTRSVTPPPPAKTLVLIALLVCVWLVDSAAVALGQRWRQEPDRLEFTGKMVVRPLQVEHWMERGFTREEAQVRYQRAVQYTVETLGEHVYRYHERMDEYWFNVPPGRSENDIGEQLIATGYYRYVCPNWWAAPSGVFTSTEMLNDCSYDPLLDNQWHLKRIEACAGWQIHSAGHDSVVLAVVDAGLRTTHEDLSNLNEYRHPGYHVFLGQWEYEGAPIWSTYPHGTVVTGAAAATGNNNLGTSGIGWSIRHRMIIADGRADETIEAMWVAAEAGDRVIVTTAFIPPDEPPNPWLDNSAAIKEAYGVLMVQAGGNDPRLDNAYQPFPDMIVVGGTDQDDARWYTSTTRGSTVGPHLDVMAPAVGIYGPKANCNTCYGSDAAGTSWATPQAGGLCALIWSYNPALTADQVRDFLYQGCDPIVDYNHAIHGHGRISVFNSLALASGSLWTRTPHPGSSGTQNKFKGAGAATGATIAFYYGMSAGATEVCPGVFVQIDNATLLGTAQAGSNGAAVLEQFVPSLWSGQTIRLQVVEQGSCRTSNVVVYQFS